MQQQIRSFILTSFLFTDDPSKLNNSDSLLEQGIMDSTGVLELVGFLESEFGLKIADEELVPDNLDSVDRIVAFVGRKQPVQPRAAAAV
jgi:acyl carrier protein